MQDRETADLHLYTGNAPIHTKQQIRQIAENIKNWGFTNPVLIDDHDTMLCGQAGPHSLTHPPPAPKVEP